MPFSLIYFFTGWDITAHAKKEVAGTKASTLSWDNSKSISVSLGPFGGKGAANSLVQGFYSLPNKLNVRKVFAEFKRAKFIAMEVWDAVTMCHTGPRIRKFKFKFHISLKSTTFLDFAFLLVKQT